MLHVPVSVCGEVYVGVRKGDTDTENFRNIEKNSHLVLLLGKRKGPMAEGKHTSLSLIPHICVQ